MDWATPGPVDPFWINIRVHTEIVGIDLVIRTPPKLALKHADINFVVAENDV